MSRDPNADAPTLIPYQDYEPPALPADEKLRHAFRRARRRLLGTEAETPMVAADRLGRMGPERLDQVARGLAHGPALEEIDATLAPWLRAGERARIEVVLVPPCDEEGVVARWAAARGLATLAAPPRARLLGQDGEPDIAGEGVLVIPRLEAWALRHREGLGAVRGLLRSLANGRRRAVVGCGIHAWGWLAAAAGVATQLPAPRTFRPFDAARLGAWFDGLLAESHDAAGRVRLSTTGEDVLARSEDGGLESDHLRILAARSRGIPWVAWHLWRGGLRDVPHAEGRGADRLPDGEGDGHALWVAPSPDPTLPPGAERESRHVLHALLVHGPLPPDMLAATLPIVGATHVLPALLDAGFVRRDEDGCLACAPAAYPAIRDALAAAGHPLGVA